MVAAISRSRSSFTALVLLLTLGLAAHVAAAVDLETIYSPTMDWKEGAGSLDWTSEAADVWEVTTFRYAYGTELVIECGAGHVVFGKHGTNVVWAVVLPDAPGTIQAAPQGKGEEVRSVYLRFNPALVSAIFPSDTVVGPGPASKVMFGKRVFNSKINSSWQAGNKPVIPWKHSLVIDAETTNGPRRFYMVDTEKGVVKYESYFENRKLPALSPITKEESEKAFEEVWAAFDKEYPMFTIRPNVDWEASRDRYTEGVGEATTSYETASIISEMLAELEDLHVWVRAGGEFVPGYSRSRPQNASWRAVQNSLTGFEDSRSGIASGTMGDIGYINVYNLARGNSAEAFDAVLNKMRESSALILDLRFNGGGDELMARGMAGRFADKAYVYSKNQYRNGPNHDDLGPVIGRTFEPRDEWRYDKPVIVLIGQRTMSSAESFALMLAQCPNVTTMGDRTAGSSANPRRVETAGGISVNLPRWLDLLPDGSPLDPDGVPPNVQLNIPTEAFTGNSDPVFDAAVKQLREAR